MPSSGLLEGLTLLREYTSLIVGRTLVDPSRWKVPVLVSNFSHDTVVVAPFSEVGNCSGLCYSIHYGAIPPTTGWCWFASWSPSRFAKPDISGSWHYTTTSPLLQYSYLFPTPVSTLIGHTDVVEHEIDTGGSSPIRCAPLRMSPQKMKKEEECVTEMLTGGQIEPSDSPWSSLVVLVTKKDGGTQFCVDYRRLNDVTVKDAYVYPLPIIDDTLYMLAGKRWFSTQVSLSQEARVKTAFATHSGLFQFRVMPFGLCNTPATFERLMDRVLQGLRWSRCLVYLDDIISFGSTFDSVLANLRDSGPMDYNWNIQNVTSFDNLCHSWDTSWVDEVWSATRQRSRTSHHGRSLIVLRACASFWGLWVTTDASFLILPTLRRL